MGRGVAVVLISDTNVTVLIAYFHHQWRTMEKMGDSGVNGDRYTNPTRLPSSIGPSQVDATLRPSDSSETPARRKVSAFE
jgi:hypothetical protein